MPWRKLLLLSYLVLAPVLLYSQQAELRELDAIYRKLEKISMNYAEIAARNPGNRGAKRLNGYLEDVLTVIEKYKVGERNTVNLEATAKVALKDANRYSTDRAEQAQEVLRDLIRLARKLPDKIETDELVEEAPTDDLEDIQLEEAEGRTEIDTEAEEQPGEPSDESATAGNQGQAATRNTTGVRSQQGVQWILFGAFSALLLAVAALLWSRQKRLQKQLNDRLNRLGDRLENLEFVSGSAEDYKGIKMNEVKKRLDTLEQNMSDFLERLEVRINDTQHTVDKLTETARQSNEASQGTTGGFQALETLEQRLEVLETRLRTGAIGTDPEAVARRQPGLPKDLRNRLQAQLEELKTSTKILVLKKRVEEVVAQLNQNEQQPPGERFFADLGRVLQLAYVSAINEKNLKAYEELKRLSDQLNLRVEDKMAGRMGLSEFYAHNIPVEEYFTSEKLQSETYPGPKIAKAEIDNRMAREDTVKNTILFTLLPTIIQQGEGGQKVVGKGEYVIKS